MYFNRIHRYMIIRIINCYRDTNRNDYYAICILHFKDPLYFIINVICARGKFEKEKKTHLYWTMHID